MIDREGIELLKRSLDEIREYLAESGGCDHEVGICACELYRLGGDITDYLIKEGIPLVEIVKEFREVTR